MHLLGKGTYGYVYMGLEKSSKEAVALKKIILDEQRTGARQEGFPITAIREMKLLSSMRHPNIVWLKDIVSYSESGDGVPSSVFMVFEFCDTDLQQVLKHVKRLPATHVQSFARQLLEALHYMHLNKIMHRDIKAANVLVKLSENVVKLGDWGLARTWSDSAQRLTDHVVTLWYRAPELLMGQGSYTSAIDLWSMGCLIAELHTCQTLFQARDELEQMGRIFTLCGTPNSEDGTWAKLSPATQAMCAKPLPRRLKTSSLWTSQGKNHDPVLVDLIDKLLRLNPADRLTAEQALDHDYFWQDVPVKDPKELPRLNFRR